MTIKVVNKYKHKPTQADVYIGRGSPLGNKYSHIPSKYPEVIKVGTRAQACACHKDWFEENWHKDQAIIDELSNILELEEKFGTVYLVCFCAPQQCHGDNIVEFLSQANEDFSDGL